MPAITPPDSHLAISTLLGGLVTGGRVIYDTTVIVVILVVTFSTPVAAVVIVEVLVVVTFIEVLVSIDVDVLAGTALTLVTASLVAEVVVEIFNVFVISVEFS